MRLEDAKAEVASFWTRWPRWWLGLSALLIAGLAVSLIARGPADATDAAPPRAAPAKLDPVQKAAVEATVRAYILAHPEIVSDAMTALQNRSVAQLLVTNQAQIETPFAGAWAGAKDGDVTLVEFFDFACPYCKAAKIDLDRLIASDPHLKVVYRDYPVISPASVEPALAALSAARQGRYRAFYAAMFDDPARVSHEKVVAGVRTARLNEVQTAYALATKADEAELRSNIAIGRALGTTGTPTYVVGNRILIGAVGIEELRRAVAEARIQVAVRMSAARAG